MTGSPTRLLAAGLALSGALLAATGLPGTGTVRPTAAPPVVAPALVTSAVPPAAPGTQAAAPAATAPRTTRTSPRPVRTTSAARTATVTPRTPVATATAKAATSRAAARTRTASATSASLCRGAGWQQRRGEAALRTLEPAAGNGYGLQFLPARTGFYGLTRQGLQRVEVYVRTCSAESTEMLRHVLAHELGHAYDLTRLTAAQRTAYLRARGLSAGTAWYGCSRCTDFATPAGDFAEVYSQWRRGASTNRSQIGDAPSRAQLEVLAKQFFGAR